MQQPQTNQERRRLVERWRASGEPARTFASRHGVALSTFYEWSKRFPALAEPAFAELAVREPVAPSSTPSIELEIAGVVVRVSPGADADSLRQVLEVLRAC